MESTSKNIPDLKTILKICGILAVAFIILTSFVPYFFPELAIFIENSMFTVELFLIFLLFTLITKSGYNLSKTLYLKKIQKNIIVPILIISVSINLFEAGFITYLQHFTNWPTFGDALAPELSPYWYYSISLILGACVTAPILEELLFRGLILSSFSQRFGPLKAVIISSFAFSLLHLVPSVVVGLFVTFIIAGWIVYKTKSIIPSIVIHALGNTVASVDVIVVGNDNIKMISELNSLADYIYCGSYVILGAIGVLMGIMWLNRKINPA